MVGIATAIDQKLAEICFHPHPLRALVTAPSPNLATIHSVSYFQSKGYGKFVRLLETLLPINLMSTLTFSLSTYCVLAS